MQFKTLENTSLEEILNVFNHSFSDYIVTVQMTMEQLKTKIKSEDIDLNYSIGVFDGDKIVGFILHAKREHQRAYRLYNGATGVIPNYRGQKLTQKMYDYILPKCKNHKIKSVILEVISSNVPAIKSYSNVGFNKTRGLNCYRGEMKINSINPDVKVKTISKNEIDSLKKHDSVIPTWQNSDQTIIQLDTVIYIGAFLENILVGYLIINQKNNRILQLGIHPDHKKSKIASTLVQHQVDHFGPQTTAINIDADSKEMDAFFIQLGLKNILHQNEMVLKLD